MEKIKCNKCDNVFIVKNNEYFYCDSCKFNSLKNDALSIIQQIKNLKIK